MITHSDIEHSLSLSGKDLAKKYAVSECYISFLKNLTITDEHLTFRSVSIPRSELFVNASASEIGRKYGINRNTARFFFSALGLSIDRSISTKQQRRKGSITPSKEQQSLIVGSLLGDGYISKDCSFGVQQCEKHRPYLEWLHEKMNGLGATRLKLKLKKVKKKTYKSYRFTCRVSDYTQKMREQFYPYGVKIIPNNLLQLLSPQALAVWYMDDGGTSWYKTKRGWKPLARIYTLGFTEDDHDLLVDYFNFQWNIIAHKTKHSAGTGFYLTFDCDETQKFFKIITPHVHRCMSYKVVHDEKHKS